MAKHIKDGFDLKLSFWKKNPNESLTNSHVEVATGVNFTRRGVGSATTNSWGKSATILEGTLEVFLTQKIEWEETSILAEIGPRTPQSWPWNMFVSVLPCKISRSYLV